MAVGAAVAEMARTGLSAAVAQFRGAALVGEGGMREKTSWINGAVFSLTLP